MERNRYNEQSRAQYRTRKTAAIRHEDRNEYNEQMAMKIQAIGHTFASHRVSGRRLSSSRARDYREAKSSSNNYS